MANTKMMGARIDLDWAGEIEALANDEGVSPAEICRSAFAQYLGKQGKGSTMQQRVRKLEKQLSAVVAQVSTLLG